MVFNVTFNNISVVSWRPVLLVEETGVPGENQWKNKNSLSLEPPKWTLFETQYDV
jgi:hypothetical protein